MGAEKADGLNHSYFVKAKEGAFIPWGLLQTDNNIVL